MNTGMRALLDCELDAVTGGDKPLGPALKAAWLKVCEDKVLNGATHNFASALNIILTGAP